MLRLWGCPLHPPEGRPCSSIMVGRYTCEQMGHFWIRVFCFCHHRLAVGRDTWVEGRGQPVPFLCLRTTCQMCALRAESALLEGDQA